MKTQRPYPRFFVTPKGEKWLQGGHAWVYDAEITRREGEAENGGLVDVLSPKGKYIGTGFLSETSKIRVRLISRNANDTFDDAFFARRLRWAWEYRKTVLADSLIGCQYPNARLIFGEADQFPGLTVDLFNDVLVIQVLSLGMELRKEALMHTLVSILEEDGLTIRGVYERNDVGIRAHEGLQENKGWLFCRERPEDTKTLIEENGILYEVDFENGQKTGFFLDQKLNRRAVARIAAGKTVLDCFTHTGSFALNAAKGGAKQVTAVDISALAVEETNANIRRNELENIVTCVEADVFDYLSGGSVKPGQYDFIILDPPAFTKSRKTVESAMRGYKEINLRAMKLLPRGGYLATCSCSHFATEELFIKMLHSAARDAGVSLRQIEARQQAPDHPILWNMDETNYLKFFLFQVI